MAKRKRARGKKAIDKTQNKMLKQINEMVKTELKKVQLNTPSRASNVAGVAVALMNSIIQGSNVNEREGNIITPIIYKMNWHFQNSDTDNYHLCRAVLVRLKTDDGTFVNADIFLSGMAAGNFSAYTEVTDTHMNTGNKLITTGMSYDILWDSGFKLLAPFNAASAGSSNTVSFNKHFKLNKSKKIYYAGAAVNSATWGTVTLITWASNAAVLNYGGEAFYYIDN